MTGDFGQQSARAREMKAPESVRPEPPVNPGAPELVLPFARRRERNFFQASASAEVPIAQDAFRSLLERYPDPGAVFLALWATLLWRFSDQAEIAVTCVKGPASSRITISFSHDSLFGDVVTQVKEKLRNHSEPSSDSAVAGFLTESDRTDTGSESNFREFQIALRVHGHPPRSVDLLYDPSCFTRETVERMARSYATMANAFATADAKLLADALPILSPEDYEQVVVKFNQSTVPYPSKCVHELFEDQVKRTPHNLALRFHDQAFTYEQLNARANQLAHLLRKQGIRANAPVALFVERSAEMIIGILAILKAGGCYVPLVHDDPQARIAYLLAEAQPPVLLTTDRLASRLPQFSGKVVRFDVPLDGEPTSNPESGAKPSDLVCIIYTSGSTGVPKGVAARHSNLANYIQFIVQRLGYPHGWHFATVSTISAILGNTSVFGSLMSGGCLHVIDYETALAPNLFADYVAKYPIDVMKIAPSQLSTLLNGSEGRRIVPRQYLAVGGEKFTWELVEQIRANGSCKVMNHYGPTETMGCCTFVADDHDFRDWKPATVPLGRPMSNQQLYIVDRYLRPVPVGVPGELCMSGAGLTDGYFNQPNQTAERFVPNPFSTDKTSRLYRTGDLARFLPDGNIEFLGRIDHQVKIRGFRVEPAEVEAVLGKLPNIKQAVVVPEDNSAGEKLLAAYVVPSGAVQSSDIYALLRQKLPEYMVPSRMLLLESLPLNRNGKVDLPALAGLQADDKSKERELAAPRNAVEEQLTAIWKEVLKQDKIDIHDNFFELGGHSLLATQVISRIRSTFGLQLPIMDLLLSPTIAELSEKISQHPDLVLTDEETERLLRELEGMSDEEAESLLAPERNRTGDVKANSGSTPQS